MTIGNEEVWVIHTAKEILDIDHNNKKALQIITKYYE